MPTDSSITLDIETAITVGSWLHRVSQHESLEPAVADSLSGLAAAIGTRIRDQEVSEAAPLELNVTTTAPSNSPSHAGDEDHSPSAAEPMDENHPAGRGDEDSLTEPSATPSSNVYDDLPAHAWDASPARGDANSSRDRAESDDYDSPSAAEPGGEAWESGPTPPSQFVTAYECEVCGSVQEMETSLKVCAYVADCPVCTAVDARFTAIAIPTLLSEDSRLG